MRSDLLSLRLRHISEPLCGIQKNKTDCTSKNHFYDEKYAQNLKTGLHKMKFLALLVNVQTNE